jgi:hypothetical protein
MPRDQRLINPDDTFPEKCHKFLQLLRELSGGDQTRVFDTPRSLGGSGLI